jgi:hypothetical protein
MPNQHFFPGEIENGKPKTYKFFKWVFFNSLDFEITIY